MHTMLKIKHLQVAIAEKQILSDISLEIFPGESHVLMGKNGAGKSTLAQSIMGNPLYSVTAEEFSFAGQDLRELDASQRAQLGIFLSFQQALEIPGLKLSSYLRMLYNKSHSKALSPVAFRKFAAEKLALLEMPTDFLSRSLNDGFSGGEKKKTEILQMLVLEPKLMILDEIDSGLDINAIKLVAKAIQSLQKQGSSLLMITHYERILQNLSVDRVHLLQAGQILQSGDRKLAENIENQGFQN
jgi:Fe-S cluster assembly ATP-binding protein